MHPGFSVIFLTTLIGAGQGLFLALYSADLAAALHLVAVPPGRGFFVFGALLSLAFTGAGAVASLFHLGHPERAWRAMAMSHVLAVARGHRLALVHAGGVYVWLGALA